MNTPRAIAILCLTLLTLAVTGNGQTTLDERLAMIPVDDLPLREPVEIYWDSHQVPFIVAANNPDLAFTLGYLHAHLRLGQIKLLAMLSQGRLSEMFGPATAKIDASLRVLNLGYASEAIYLSMDDATKEWLDLFVKGLNTYQERMASPPPEYAWLGLSPSPFTPIDILTIGRLAGADVNWGKLLPYLEHSAKDPESWPDRWETIRILNEKGIA
ncbi:MAG: penicillin acylase family protein, partial [Opitutales bacterium]|nr:penicillin acylase family protein [Opitutales bacterium]